MQAVRFARSSPAAPAFRAPARKSSLRPGVAICGRRSNACHDAAPPDRARITSPPSCLQPTPRGDLYWQLQAPTRTGPALRRWGRVPAAAAAAPLPMPEGSGLRRRVATPAQAHPPPYPTSV